MKNNRNLKQDIAIAELKVMVQNLKERLDVFITNDFAGLKKKVEGIESKILYGFIILIATTLVMQVILKLF